jgi:outer membrane protein
MRTCPLLLALAALPAAAFAPRPALAEALRVLTLAQAERAAMTQQPQVLAARAQTGLAEATAEQAGAPLLPQVTATAQYLRTTGNFAPRPGVTANGAGGAPPGVSLDPKYDYWNFGANASQLIYDFGQTTGKYRSASVSADAQRVSEQTTRLQVLFVVRRAYFGARAQRELVAVASETLSDQQKHLGQVRGFVDAGTQPRIALAQQQAAVANARVQLITAQNNYETAKAQLNQAAGIPGDTDYDVGDEIVGPVEDEDQPLETLVGKAILARPELSNLVKQREAQEVAVRAARGGYGPTLSATAAATEQGTSLDGMVPNWNAGLLLSWPLFQGGLTIGEVHQAQAGLANVDAQRSLEELQIRLDVNSARLAIRAAKATIGASDDALGSATEQLRLAEQRYATGVGSIIELNDAQVGYTSAAAQVVQARYGLASARAQLLAALGRL